MVPKIYQKGVKIDDFTMSTLNIIPAQILPKWNYAIAPR
jgi:hypothetical protein